MADEVGSTELLSLVHIQQACFDANKPLFCNIIYKIFTIILNVFVKFINNLVYCSLPIRL